MFDLSLQPGTHVTPNIRLVRLLGHGGMGSVWVADHLGLRTQVVVKFVSSQYASSAEVRERFEREAALAALAKSPNVVQVLDHGSTASGVPYIAMELLEGEDLGKRIDRDRVIAPEIFADWLVQACKGLGRAHRKGIIHRDIKPENIFLCETDSETVVKVLDFGIAKGGASFAATKTGAFLGTAYYMSPEQTMGGKYIDLRTDLWSMAVTAYFALTGVRPFEASSIGEIVVAITQAPIAPPSARNARLSPAIDAWMTKALARPLEERFSSAQEMAEAFVIALREPGVAPNQDARPFAPSATVPVPAMPLLRISTNIGVVSEHAAKLDTDDMPVPGPPITAPSMGMKGALIACALAVVLAFGGALATFGSASRSTHVAAAPTPLVAPSETAHSELVASPAIETAVPSPTASAIAEQKAAPRPIVEVSRKRPTPAATSVVTSPSAGPVQSANRQPASPPATATNRLKMGLE